MKYTVKVSEDVRLDKWLAEAAGISRAKTTKFIKDGAVSMNGATTVDPRRPVTAGEEYEITLPEPAPASSFKPADLPLDIVFEDEHFMIVNKQPGIVVHPGAGNPDGTLINALVFHGKPLSNANQERPGLIHRLDKDTSGLLIVAKNDFAHVKLAKLLADHQITKTYMAIVVKTPVPPVGKIETQIGRSRSNRQKMAFLNDGGKHALTFYKTAMVLDGGKYSAVECTLITGRTHQIRVHMAHIGNPIIGDTVYGRPMPDIISRQALHAMRLEFIHPITGKAMRFEAPLPVDMQNAVLRLGG